MFFIISRCVFVKYKQITFQPISGQKCWLLNRVEAINIEYGNIEDCNIKLGVKRGVKRGQRGHSIPYHHQQSPPNPNPPPHPMGGPFRVCFQFSILVSIDSMLPFFSMLPYSMLIAFPLNSTKSRILTGNTKRIGN